VDDHTIVVDAGSRADVSNDEGKRGRAARAGGAQSDESPRRDADPSRELRRGDANATRTTRAPREDVCARPRVCLNNGI